MLWCWFVVSVALCLGCAWWRCCRLYLAADKNQVERVLIDRVLIVEAGFPASCLEEKLWDIGRAWRGKSGCCYLWDAAGGEVGRMLPTLALRWGFVPVDETGIRQLAAGANNRFYRLTAGGLREVSVQEARLTELEILKKTGNKNRKFQ